MLKPKTILIFSGLVLGSLLEKGYAMNPVDVCRKGVSSVARLFFMSTEERETLALTENIMGRLKTAFLGEEIRGSSPELAERMDEVFDWEVRKKLASLTLTELRKVEEIVMRDWDFPDDGSLQAFAAVTDMGFFNSNNLAIVVNPNFPPYHPFRRIVLIHELEHVIDFALGRNLEKTVGSMLRLEANAAIAEYQYITRVFNFQDLEGLERNLPVIPQSLHERVGKLFDVPQHTNNGIFIEGLSVKEAIARFINSKFMANVEDALTVDQDTYVEAVVKKYIPYKDGGLPFPMLAEERETLTQNIMGRLKTMLGEEIMGLSEELAQRMDEVFYREVRKRIALLTPTQLRRMEEIMMRVRAVPNSGLRSFAEVRDASLPNFRPAIVFNPNLPLHHPLRRIVLIHELEHVIDLASGIVVFGNRTSVLRAEMGAAIAEYQYINMVFNLQDLEGFERNLSILPWNLHERAREFFRLPQHTNNEIFVKGLSVKEAVARFINSSFMAKVQVALTVEQDTYVEVILEPYRR